MRGGVSQSAQFAPFDAGYNWSNASAEIYNTSKCVPASSIYQKRG